MSRPRRTAAAVAATADPEFLALSSRQKRSIDRAFSRGIEALQRKSTSKSKRRKLDLDDGKGKGKEVLDAGASAGGFMDDDGDDGAGRFMDDAGGGGFIDDDTDGGGGGGFMVEDDGLEGGFMPDTNNDNTTSRSRGSTSPPTTTTLAARIPLYILPGLLTSLGLPSDEDVLAVFKASASGWDDHDHVEQERFRKRGLGLGEKEEEEEQLGVELKDFRAVCAALMDPESEKEGDNDDVLESLPSEDGSEFGSELSSLDSDSEYGGSPTKPRVKATDYADEKHSTSTLKRSKRGGKKMRALEEEGKPKLSSKQKELVQDLWEMLKTPLASTNTSKTRGTDANILGREQIKSHIRALGEMWTDDEITEMITLFSTQHQGRGLSYDDFGVVMLRAGLV